MNLSVGTVISKWVPVICILLALPVLEILTIAQAVEARVSNITRGAIRINNARKFNLRRGDALAPGDEIDTRSGGRVVIEMTDGSLVTVQPGSHIIFKDYRFVSSLRELFQVFIGRVRVKIAHYGGRPNPYRVNSPTASILVRGTEFGVLVGASGETQVVVYEGQVEVESLSIPNRRTLVSPGRGVLVRHNEYFQFFTPGPGSEIGERGNRSTDQNQQFEKLDNQRNNASGVAIRNYVAGEYERYIDSLVEPGQTPPLIRFTAFPDSHLDSLENPAYATEFNAMEGRITFVTSRSNLRQRRRTNLLRNFNPVEPVDSGLLVQNNFFLPVSRSGLVIGGSVAGSHSKVESFSRADIPGAPSPLYPNGVPGTRLSNSATGADSVSGSFMLARKFGEEGRTSIGFGVDHVSGRGTLNGLTSLSNIAGLSASERIEASSDIKRTRFKFGLTHESHGRHKFGLFYGQGITSANDSDVSRTFNGLPLSLDSVQYTSQSTEIGLRFRGPLSKKLYYGGEAFWLTTGLDEKIHRAAIVDAFERERITRAAASFGIGYSLRPRTVLSADLGAGYSRVRETYFEQATGNPLIKERQDLVFASLQTGAQTDLWRNTFINVSVFTLAQSRTNDIRLFPDRYGRLLNSRGLFVPDGIKRRKFADFYADFGAGWRLSRNILAEYILAHSFDGRAPNHIVLLRYTFRREQ